MRRWGKGTLDETLGAVLFFALTGAAGVALASYVTAGGRLLYGKARSDFLLMTMQCALALLGMTLPRILDRKLRLQLPAGLYALFYAFLFCAVFLGEILSFYYLFPLWDVFLHFFSGVMLCYLGFFIAQSYADRKQIRLGNAALFAFSVCFSLALGALWEGYEYVMDGVLHMNMQKFADENLSPFTGRAALRDTMEDLLVDALSAVVTAAVLWRKNLTCKR